jgi:hypothetical protein
MKDYEREVLQSAENNHLWLNAFACVRPTEAFCAEVGREILRMLADDGNTILSSTCRPGGILEGLNQRVLVLRVNKS